MRTYFNCYKRIKKKYAIMLRCDLLSWHIGFDVFKNYAYGATEIRIQILCFAFNFRRYWEI